MSDQSRRKLLKSIAAGSGAIVAGKSLPESWSRPVVDSVLLPAHAQTSPAVYAANLASLAMLESEIKQAGNDRGLINALIPDANAQYEDPVNYLCITVLGGVFYGRFAREYSPEHIDEYSNSGGTLGNTLELSLFSGCGNGILPPMLTVSNPTPTGVDFTLDYGTGPINGTLPLGDCSIVPEGVCLLPSDIAIKDNFSPVDEQEILRKIA
ncbi:MAG: hypothetical protein KAJ95_02825, partial [Gammaproteobacteria bacterium]|nr:hypothetical protein [Gammaproteobacteria bacterium]